MKCNKCWKPQELAGVLPCSHLFCRECAIKIQSAGCCPLCNSQISRRDWTSIDFNQTPDANMICGFSPKIMMEIAAKNFNFWSFQKQTEVEFHKNDTKKALQEAHKLEQTHNDQSLEMANQINVLKHKNTQISDELAKANKELQETKMELEQRTQQKRKLADLYEDLRQKSGVRLSSPSFLEKPNFVESSRQSPSNTRENSIIPPSPSPFGGRTFPSSSSSNFLGTRRPISPSVAPPTQSLKTDRFEFAKSMSPTSGLRAKPKTQAPAPSFLATPRPDRSAFTGKRPETPSFLKK
eukprot:TRINITY_DN8490_c0_g1_i1.p1 TRINITY_DN8490_c0_g1~~TRINITY_DN8490_c0_g1_i1.p1  ORF type:complete len:295 (+),score=99.83 TRINITY_DN8490_c0_g1_i1:132-1016(+)